MKIGIIGAGKLGLPVALAIDSKGHDVSVYDISPEIEGYLKTRLIPYKEEGSQKLLDNHNIKWEYPIDAEIIFIAIDTPHDPEYEGVTRLPKTRKNFKYFNLKSGYDQLCSGIRQSKNDPLVVIISTCLPGTVESFIDPKVRTVYNPFFIAMGTVIHDFLNPEFVLIGCDNKGQYVTQIHQFYLDIHGEENDKTFFCSIREAEMIKVSYNTFITTKICMANTIMEICHKVGVNCDTVMDALFLGTDRLISTKYLRGGMGDGGGCHPRDNIAMSWLAKNTNSFDWYENLLMQRESQTNWFADIIIEQKLKNPELEIHITDYAFKPETDLCTGSPAMLLNNILTERGYYVIMGVQSQPAIYFVGVKRVHEFPQGSIVIDPHRIIDQKGIKIISIGK